MLTKKLDAKCCITSFMALKTEEMQEIEMIKQLPLTPLVFMHNDAVFSYMVRHIHFSPGKPSGLDPVRGVNCCYWIRGFFW